MIVDIACMLVANAATLLGAFAILQKVKTGKSGADFALLLLLRITLVSAAMILAGLTGMLGSLALGTAGAIVLIGIFASGVHRTLEFSRLPRPGAALGLLVCLAGIKILLQIWYFSPYNADALSYHLPKVAEWVREGCFTREMGVDTTAPFPAGFELVEAWWVIFLHHDVLIEVAGLEFALLAFASVYALAEHLGYSPRGAFLASLAYVLTPAVQIGMTATVNDMPVAAVILATAAMIASRMPLQIILLAAGLGAGIKPIYAYAVPGLAIYWLWMRRCPGASRISSSLATGLILTGMLVGCVWYVRNLAWFGNPIHPIGAEGIVLPTGERKLQLGASLESGLSNLSDLIENRIYDRSSRFSPSLIHIAGWGLAVFACGLPSIAGLLRENVDARRLGIAMLISLVSVLMLVIHDPWNMRFVMFFPVVPCLALAWAGERQQAMYGLVFAALIFQCAATILPGDFRWPRLQALCKTPWKERSMISDLHRSLPAGPVAYYSLHARHNRGEAYLLYGPDFRRRVVYLRGENADQLLGELREGGARALYVAQTVGARVLPVEELEERGHLRRVADRIYVVAQP